MNGAEPVKELKGSTLSCPELRALVVNNLKMPAPKAGEESSKTKGSTEPNHPCCGPWLVARAVAASKAIHPTWSESRTTRFAPKEQLLLSYKLGLTPGEKLWDDLMLNPPNDLRDLMMQVEMYARLEDDVKHAERALGEHFPGEMAHSKDERRIRKTGKDS
ncbi:hypothetical protein Acr_00g0099310 [Actinidia rufa]|uniref:Uncharacterized protein n=1 Tax=Actinidia rufa TaxID=165716 RepID=A0A7J0E0L9_9ERIC|nr:hypothetical protein Acr_00g0099310 [Actinidia rufa]